CDRPSFPTRRSSDLLSLVVLGLELTRRWGYALITLVFLAPWLDFAGMWLTKLVSSQFAVLTVAGGWAMGLGYTIVTGVALWQMRSEEHTSELPSRVE